MASGNFAEAIPLYQQLIKALPDNPGLMLNLGIAQHMAGGHDREAILQFQAVLKQQPQALPALILLGASYLRVGDPIKAIPPLEKSVAAQPNDKETRQMLADALVMTNRHGAAAEQLKRLAEIDPQDPKTWYELGQRYEALSQQAFEKLQKTAPGSFYVLELLADARRSQGRRAAAEALQHEASAVKPAATKAAEALYKQTKHYNQLAVEAFSHLERLPPSVELHRLLAETMRNQDRHRDSIGEWREALKLAPGDPHLEQELAVSIYLSKDYAAAEPMLRGVLQNEPTSPELNFYLGDTLLNLQRPVVAIPLLLKVPQMPAAHAALGRAYMETGQAAEAIPHLKVALPIDDDGSLHYQLSRAYQTTGQSTLAKEALAKYQEIVKARESQKADRP